MEQAGIAVENLSHHGVEDLEQVLVRCFARAFSSMPSEMSTPTVGPR
jgi:hypothetical protein